MSDIAALVTLLAGGPLTRVYPANAVPENPVYPYVVLALAHAAPGPATSDGHKSTPKRLVARAFARTSEGLEEVCAALDSRLNGRALPLAGSPVAEFEMSTDVDRDAATAGVLGSLMTYKF